MNYELLFKNIRYLRENKNLTQNEIAKILNTSSPNYTRWETKEKIIPLTKLNDLCNYFNASMDYVIGFKNQYIPLRYNKQLNKKVIAKRLKYIRTKNNITQTELAHLLNTTQSVISSYEAGKTLSLTSFAIEICNNLKLSRVGLCGRK